MTDHRQGATPHGRELERPHRSRRNVASMLSLWPLAFLLGCDMQPSGEADFPETPGAAATEPASSATEGGVAPDAAAQAETNAQSDNAQSNTESTVAVLGSAGPPRARAQLEPTQGNDARGYVEFTRAAHGVSIEADLSGLEPGTHGIHVHEFGDCSAPDGSSAGDHFAPDMDPHGAPRDEPDEHHVGDLGNITADETGSARKEMSDAELTLDEGEFGVVGRAVVVHADADDLMSQPSGEAGDPIACGVVELAENEARGRG